MHLSGCYSDNWRRLYCLGCPSHMAHSQNSDPHPGCTLPVSPFTNHCQGPWQSGMSDEQLHCVFKQWPREADFYNPLTYTDLLNKWPKTVRRIRSDPRAPCCPSVAWPQVCNSPECCCVFTVSSSLVFSDCLKPWVLVVVPWGQHQCTAIHLGVSIRWPLTITLLFSITQTLMTHIYSQENPGLKATWAAQPSATVETQCLCFSTSSNRKTTTQASSSPLTLPEWGRMTTNDRWQPHARGISSILLHIGRNFSSEKLEVWFLKIHSFPEVVNTDVIIATDCEFLFGNNFICSNCLSSILGYSF